MRSLPVAPETRQLFELVPHHFIVGVEHRVHVRVKALERIDCCQVKLYFNLIVWVGTDYKVNVVPV